MGRLITAEKKDRVLLHVTIDIAVMEDIYTQKLLQEENKKIDFLDLLDVTIWTCPYQTGRTACLANWLSMNSRGERMRKPECGWMLL